MKTIAVIGALDTKEKENRLLAEQIRRSGMKVWIADLGVLGDPGLTPDVSAAEIAALGGVPLEVLRKEKNREKSLQVIAKGAAAAVRQACDSKVIDGIVAMGGGQGTYLAAQVFRSLPIGFPKVMVSTIATSAFDQQRFEGINDTMVINPLVDVAGENSLLAMIIERAAGAITGMVRTNTGIRTAARPKIGVTMWGVTTPCVSEVERILNQNGCEVLVFHATGLGGRAMEDLIRDGELAGVIDLTLAELSNQIIGGTFAKCGYRCETAGRMGIPQVIVPGGVDMIKYVPPENLPGKFKDRRRYMHNPELLFVRSSAAENAAVGRTLAAKLNAARGYTAVVFPKKGLSAVDRAGEVFFDPDADRALLETLRQELRPDITLTETDLHINDPEFARQIAALLLEALSTRQKKENENGH